MGELIDLEDYRRQRAEQEVVELKQEFDELIEKLDLPPVYPEPYFPTIEEMDYFMSPPAGSFGCPFCSPPTSLGTSYGIDKDES